MTTPIISFTDPTGKRTQYQLVEVSPQRTYDSTYFASQKPHSERLSQLPKPSGEFAGESIWVDRHCTTSSQEYYQSRRRSEHYHNDENGWHQPSPTHSEPPSNRSRSSPSKLTTAQPLLTPSNTPVASAHQPSKILRNRILFYHKHLPYYGFTNFSPHPVEYKGRYYPTSEHLFQSFKFQGHRPLLAEHIRTCSNRPSLAFSEAQRYQPEVRHDWKTVSIEKMDETLLHKFTQHADLRKQLLDTGDAELVEDSDKDSFWGVGADGKGRNELGKALERLRAHLRKVR